MSTPRDQTLALMTRKDAIQADLDAQFAILQAQNCTMNTSLVDKEGFPRADIDVWEVRHARVKIIMLRNDMEAVMNEIGKSLQAVYDPAQAPPDPAPAMETRLPTEADGVESTLKPFARVDGVAPGSPAAEAGLKREDLLLKFGTLTHDAFSSNSLLPLADLVAAHENQPLQITIQRGNNNQALRFTPRKGWGGRGMLGCHLVPYTN